MKIITSLFLLLYISSFVNGQIFVKHDATGNNDGTSWHNAFTKLQPALDQADTGDQIWIAAGTYIPEGPSPDSSHFLVKNGLAIYGGFNGTESKLEERELWKDTTTLSGDIFGDDLPGEFSIYRSDNAHHILILDGESNAIIVDGLVFAGGSTRLDNYAPDSSDMLRYDRWSGAALYIRKSPVKIRNCTFRDNNGYRGSGLYAHDNSSSSNELVIESSKFIENY